MIDLKRLTLAGMETKEWKHVYVLGMILSLLFGILSFAIRYNNAYHTLFWRNGGWEALKADAVMLDFVEILGRSLLGYQIVAALMIAAAVMCYVYHFQDSQSIYTMRRLPNRFELHRRCLTLPICGIGISLVCAFVLLLIFYTFYMLVTPEVCLAPGQWQKLWRELL